jgi:hypothetical protein
MPDVKGKTTYSVTINTVTAGGAVGTYELEITDRGETEPLLTQYNGLVFEIDRDMLNKLSVR